MKRLLLVAVLTMLVALPLSAQQQYGSLAGVAVDNQKLALPGVTVTLTGPFMQGSRTVLTDAQGRYRFMPVPPGAGYTVKFELSGFNTLEKSDLTVNVGKETALNAEMSLAQFAETITVSADKIVVDTSKSTVDTTVDWALADSIATNRNFTTLMTMAPGVKDANNPYVHGASGDQNGYFIDGVDTTDPKTKTWGAAINWDTIQEAQLQTGAYSAEFGRATGGIINLVTKSGGNQFSFTGRVIAQRMNWGADSGIEKETGQRKAIANRTEETRPSITVGGPLAKDKLWFYLAYEGRSNSRSYSRYASLNDVIAGNQLEKMTDYKGHYASAKFTYQLNSNNSLVAYYISDPITLSPLHAGWDAATTGIEYSESTEVEQFQGGNNYTLQWYGVVSPKLFLEAKYQHVSQVVDVNPIGTGFGTSPTLFDNDYSYQYGAPDTSYKSTRDRRGGLLTASYFADTDAAGSHQFKGGVEYLTMNPKSGNLFNPAGTYSFQRNDAGVVHPYDLTLYYDQLQRIPTTENYVALFVQDSWRFGGLTVNAGVRAEETALKDNTGKQVLKFGLGKQIAPRLGFAYDLKGDSLHGSASRFYDLASDYIAEYVNNLPTKLRYSQWNGSCAYDASRSIQSYPASCWDVQFDEPIGGSSFSIAGDIKPVYVDEFTFGYDKVLSSRFAAGINYVWREQKRTIDTWNPWSAATGTYDIQNAPPNGKFSEYQAVELNLKKRFGADGFQFIANYTYVIHSKGWLSTTRSYAQLGRYFEDPFRTNTLWYGERESPHDFKFNGSWTSPWRTVFGLSAYWNSGNVYTAYQNASMTNPDYPGTTFRGRQALERGGSSRVGNNWEASVHVEHPVKLGPANVALYIDLFNAFNNQQPRVRNANALSASFNNPTSWQQPRSLQLGFKIEM